MSAVVPDKLPAARPADAEGACRDHTLGPGWAAGKAVDYSVECFEYGVQRCE